MTVGWRFGAILVVLFAGVMGFWWWGLNDYRETAATVDRLEADMDKMRAHVAETERVLAAIDSLKEAVQNARKDADEALEDSRRYNGCERLDKLERLLEEDLDRRRSCGASEGVAGGLR